MDLERHAAREQASQWLAKLERGLRLDEGPALRKWLQPIPHRTAILEVARQRASPDVMALLSELIPLTLTPGPQAPPRGPAGILVSVAAAAFVVITAIWTFNHHRFVATGQVLPPLTRNTITSPAVLTRQLGRIRRQGYAVTRGELEIGLDAVAAPVHARGGELVASIGVSGPSDRVTHGLRALADLLTTQARSLSALLGHPARKEGAA